MVCRCISYKKFSFNYHTFAIAWVSGTYRFPLGYLQQHFGALLESANMVHHHFAVWTSPAFAITTANADAGNDDGRSAIVFDAFWNGNGMIVNAPDYIFDAATIGINDNDEESRSGNSNFRFVNLTRKML